MSIHTHGRRPTKLAPLAIASAMLALGSGGAAAADRIDLLIEQLQRQNQEIQALKKEVAELRGKVEPAAAQPTYFKEDGDEPLTQYDNPGLQMTVAGQVNQAYNLADDGQTTQGYFVDNDNSNSRMRLAAVASFAEGPQVGSTLEVAFSGNNSFDVSQDNERADDFMAVRRADVWLLDERYGRVMFGRGSSAADNTAEFDLSLVSAAVMLSGVAFPMGGLQFTDGDSLTGVAIGDAFFNFDGDRMNRFRYDTPMFGPLQVSASAGSDQRYSVALTYGGDYDHWTGVELGGFTTLGALAIADPNVPGVDYRWSGSWSMLHNDTGLSLTVSSGLDSGTEGDTPYNLYGKIGWDTRLLRFGPTGFGIDYAYTENVTAEGDQGQSFGVAAVQVFERFGIEIYSQLRWLSLDRATGPDFKDILVFTNGTRVRF
jgi:predicted porin